MLLTLTFVARYTLLKTNKEFATIDKDDIKVLASIHTAQAEGDTQFLINELCAVRDFAQGLINNLKEIEK